MFSSASSNAGAAFTRRGPDNMVSKLIGVSPGFELAVCRVSGPEGIMHRRGQPGCRHMRVRINSSVVPRRCFRLGCCSKRSDGLGPFIRHSRAEVSHDIEASKAKRQRTGRRPLSVYGAVRSGLGQRGDGDFRPRGRGPS